MRRIGATGRRAGGACRPDLQCSGCDVGVEVREPGASSRQTEKLVRKFDCSLGRTADVLVGKFGAENSPVMRREMLDEFRRLIPEVPYIGGRHNPYSEILVGVGRGLAIYLVVVRHGGACWTPAN
jgi:hypothetical protein